ncbi:MAG: hypothetical protein GY786_08970 [Proteobacteria bacterium]|nr:hypothetical protein [Pseudomonadota bacterium]
MNSRFMQKISLFLIFVLFTGNSLLWAQPASPPKTVNNLGNLYTTWVKLALKGKNQAEIEFFFRGIQEKSILEIKNRLRSAVIDNLRRSGLTTMIQKSTDVDDFNTVVRKIITEIRYLGMEHDIDLKLTIKDEFGVVLERL